MDELARFKEEIQQRAFFSSRSGDEIAQRGSGSRNGWLFDFRALILEPRWLNSYAEFFWERYPDKLPFQVAGIESTGIALVAAIIMKSVERGISVNGIFLRKERKNDGRMRIIEGTPTNEPVIIVDDIINSGRSLEKQYGALADAGLTVAGAFAVLSFRDPSHYRIGTADITTLFTTDDFRLTLSAHTPPNGAETALSILWRVSSGKPNFNWEGPKSAPLYTDGTIYFGTDDGTFYALSSNDGSERWHFQVGRTPKGKGILSTAKRHDGKLYFGAYDGTVYALDAKNGTCLWRFHGAEWVGSSPALVPKHNLLFIGLEHGLFRRHGGIVALDMRTGTRVWEQRMPEFTHSSPCAIPKERSVIIGGNEQTLYSFGLKDGQELWRFQMSGNVKAAAAYDPKRRRIFAGDLAGSLYSLDARTGTCTFSRTLGPVYSTPLISGDTVYISSLDKCLYAFDTENGDERWRFETRGRMYAPPVIIGDSLWVGATDGRLYELDPQTGAERSSFQASERIVNAPATDGQHIFLLTAAHELYCLERIDKKPLI